MFKLKLIIYVILFFPIFLFDIFSYKYFRKKNSELSHQYMIKLFCLFGKNSNLFIKDILKKNSELDFKMNDLSIIENLKNNGFYLHKNYISENKLKLIKNHLIDNCLGRYESDNIKIKRLEKIDLNYPQATSFRYSTDDILKSKEIQELIIDPNILSTCQNYFQATPIIDIVSAWWSFPSEKPDNYSAQFWHFDLDRPVWLKMFIFLTDCNERNGAHKFIKKSHNNHLNNFPNKGYERLNDLEVENIFKNEDIITMKAREGTMLLEDTLGLHKGQKLLEGNRLVLQVQYSSNLFGSSEIKKIKFPKEHSSLLLNFKEKYPEVFANFYN